jgi:hypothetical protein
MKYILIVLLIGSGVNAYSQHDIKPTEQFTIEGLVKAPFTFQLKDASKYMSVRIDSVVIKNHLKERKGVVKNLRGILLKEILANVTIAQDQPKLLSEYYFVLVASDGYKVVFSWNEIFNTQTGEYLFIVTEKDGKSGEAVPDRIALMSPGDDATGTRFVKGLAKIIVKRAE